MTDPNTTHAPSADVRQEWRCARCRLLLGVRRDGRVEVRIKTSRYVIDGAVTATCRRCGSKSECAGRPSVRRSA